MFNGKIIKAGMNAKTIKGDGSEFETAIFYGTPFKMFIEKAGKKLQVNSCAFADIAKCFEGCLYSAGRGKFSSVQKSRTDRTTLFYTDRDLFLALLVKDIEKFEVRCIKNNIKPCVRLNGTTDIQWEKIKVPKYDMNIFEIFPNVQFYDYTKIYKREVSTIPNYHLTWSYSQANKDYAKEYKTALNNGMNIAVVFRDKLPETFLDLPVIDGDKDDLRFLDNKAVVVGLKAKGDAKKDVSGFVIDI